MPVRKEDLVLIPITDDMRHTAKYLSNKRSLFEYPRKGYGSYSGTNHIGMIESGILGELAFLEYVTNRLNDLYGHKDPEERYSILHIQNQFSYTIVVGNFDNGFDFEINQKTIDVKTYSQKLSLNKMLSFHLLIDEEQNTKADIYIQAFLVEDKVCLAGYNVGLPELNKRFPKPAYAKKVVELTPMENIFKELNLIR